MDWVVALIVGLVAGSVFTWFWLSIRNDWKKSKDLKSSAAKAHKEQVERAQKAKQDAKRSRDTAFRTVFQFLLFVGALALMGWIIWLLVQL